jgi:hypothetical protein
MTYWGWPIPAFHKPIPACRKPIPACRKPESACRKPESARPQEVIFRNSRAGKNAVAVFVIAESDFGWTKPS